MRNLPEPETSALRVTLVYKGRSRPLICDVYDFIDCDSAECALDLYDSYVQRYIEAVERDVISIENVKGGKVYLYKADGDILCVCVHRIDVNCEDLCKDYAE